MYPDIKIMTNNVEETALMQIQTIATSEAFKGAKIRIMPDVHAGVGSVVGFTARNMPHIIPNVIGVDIGCGMLVINLGDIDINFRYLDRVIRENIPSGFEICNTSYPFPKLEQLYCYSELRDTYRILSSIGTLGGGNHFIEIDEARDGTKYLVIHSGSRNLGSQIAKIYQNKAIKYCEQGGEALKQAEKDLIQAYKEAGRQSEIHEALIKLKQSVPTIDKDLAFLSPEDAEKYLHDIVIAQEYATLNRKLMAQKINLWLGTITFERWESVHNYYDPVDQTIRKGAISARKGQKVIIPLNMRDGCLIAIGKGNSDWNESAPHGAGRILSRGKAKEAISLEAFKESMQGIYTSCVREDTLDESPFAYKDSQEIIDAIGDTVDIIEQIKPLYNFKA